MTVTGRKCSFFPFHLQADESIKYEDKSAPSSGQGRMFTSKYSPLFKEQDPGRQLLMNHPIPSGIIHPFPSLTNLKSFSPNLLLIPLFTSNCPSWLVVQA